MIRVTTRGEHTVSTISIVGAARGNGSQSAQAIRAGLGE